MSARSDTILSLPLRRGLEVQSSPIQLATRSLSARSSTSSLSSSSLNHNPSSTRTKQPSLRRNDSRKLTSTKSHSKPSNKRKKSSTTKPTPKSREEIEQKNNFKAEQEQIITQKGFNIVGHLRNSIELDQSSGSLSPDVDQFLKDIGAVVRPKTPDRHPPALHHGWQDSQGCQTNKDTAESTCDSVENHPTKPLRPQIAAKFGVIPNQTPATIVPTLLLDPGNSLQSNKITNTQVSLERSSPPSPQAKHLQLDENVAATKIQSWYRQKRSFQLSSVQSVLQEKKDQLNRSRAPELLDSESKEIEKQQRRAAKMQAARKAAIAELNKKREEKRLRAEKIAQGEIVSVLEK